MRRLIQIVLFLLLAIVALWLGGESLLVSQLRGLSQAGIGFQANSVTALREPGRMGADLQQVGLDTPLARFQMPQVQLFVKPTAPTTVQLALPATGTADLGRGPQPLTLTNPVATARVNPTAGFVPRTVDISSGPVTLSELPLAESVTANASMVSLGDDAPQDSIAAYDTTLELRDLEPAVLPRLSQVLQALGVEGKATLTAGGRVWLDRAATPAAIAGAEPLPTGLRIDQAQLSVGRLEARFAGFVRPDADGRAIGAVAIYTRDATPILEAAAKAGLIPNGAVKLAGSMLRSLSGMELPGEKADTSARPYPIVWAKPTKDEMRLPIIFTKGKMMLGPITLGPAPMLRP